MSKTTHHGYGVGDYVAAPAGWSKDGQRRYAYGVVVGFHGPDNWPLVRLDRRGGRIDHIAPHSLTARGLELK